MAIISQGKFTSTGVNVNLNIRSDVDYIRVYNYTAATNDVAVGAVESYWQRGMSAGTGISINKATVSGSRVLTESVFTSGGFTLFDNSVQVVGNPVAFASVSQATKPIVATGNTAGLTTGSVVILSGATAVPNGMGIPFEVDTVVANTSFRIRWDIANVNQTGPVLPFGAVGGAGNYRIVTNPAMFQPERRFISNITSAGTTTVVTTTVTHGYSVGEEVRIYIPSASNGMTQIDGLQGTVTAVNLTTNTFTLDIDSSSFTPFVWSPIAAWPSTAPQCMAFGSVGAGNLTLLDDATRNDSYIGMTLGGGAGFPAGANNDVIYWVACKSDQITNV